MQCHYEKDENDSPFCQCYIFFAQIIVALKFIYIKIVYKIHIAISLMQYPLFIVRTYQSFT